MSFGLRYEAQTHTDDYLNFAPRFGSTWSPLKSGATTVRGGVGIFYEWYDSQLYEQTLRVDGTRQTDLVVQNPGFPDPFEGGDVVVLPASRYQQAADLVLPRTFRTNVGVEQAVGKYGRINVGYSFARGSDLLRGRNVNAPLADGTRPDAEWGNVTLIESTARSQAHVVNTGFNINLPWRRTFLFVNYSLAKAMNDTDGAFSLPVDSFDAGAEIAPAQGDVRHRVSGMFNMNLWQGFKLATSFSGNSAPPYNITTGRDDNNDTVSNDRPTGVGRNAPGRTTAGISAHASATRSASAAGPVPTARAGLRSWSSARAAAARRRWAASAAEPRTGAGGSSSTSRARTSLITPISWGIAAS